MPPDIDMPGS